MGSMDTSKRVSVQWWNYAPKGKNTALSKILISRRSADSVRSGDLVPLFCAIMMVQSNQSTYYLAVDSDETSSTVA
jgi:hypothetical protein